MVLKAKIEIEQFDNGVTMRYYDVEDVNQEKKTMAVNGREASSIGGMIWSDISDALSNADEKVIVHIEYEPVCYAK